MVRSSHMKQTSHYQLNQYEASDCILHGDFNSDNQKIDAALKSNADAVAAETAAREAGISALQTALGKKAGLQLIQTVPFPEGGSSADKPLTIQWSDWAIVLAVYQEPSDGRSYTLSFTTANAKVHPIIYDGPDVQTCALYFPLYDQSRPVRGLLWSAEKLSYTTTYEALTGIQLKANTDSGSIAGAKVTFYGIR